MLAGATRARRWSVVNSNASPVAFALDDLPFARWTVCDHTALVVNSNASPLAFALDDILFARRAVCDHTTLV